MEPRAPEVFPKQTGRHGSEDTPEKLRDESSQLLGAPSNKRQVIAGGGRAAESPASERSAQMRGLKGELYSVMSGDNLTSIAQRMLKLRGENYTARDIHEEVSRIVELNTEKYPWLAKNPNKIRAGMVIQVWDKDTGPDPSCRWKDWKEAASDHINIALKCESIFAGKGTQVVVTPGARAVFTESSYGFVAPKGHARVLPGSHVMAVGGDVIDDGGELKVLHPDTKVSTVRRTEADSTRVEAIQQDHIEIPPI